MRIPNFDPDTAISQTERRLGDPVLPLPDAHWAAKDVRPLRRRHEALDGSGSVGVMPLPEVRLCVDGRGGVWFEPVPAASSSQRQKSGRSMPKAKPVQRSSSRRQQGRRSSRHAARRTRATMPSTPSTPSTPSSSASSTSSGPGDGDPPPPRGGREVDPADADERASASASVRSCWSSQGRRARARAFDGGHGLGADGLQWVLGFASKPSARARGPRGPPVRDRLTSLSLFTPSTERRPLRANGIWDRPGTPSD